jgi:hypothetical protein
MKLPEIGDTINTKEALELCRYFGIDYFEGDSSIYQPFMRLLKNAAHHRYHFRGKR